MKRNILLEEKGEIHEENAKKTAQKKSPISRRGIFTNLKINLIP